jgi:hypothetical protein
METSGTEVTHPATGYPTDAVTALYQEYPLGLCPRLAASAAVPRRKIPVICRDHSRLREQLPHRRSNLMR